MTVQHISEILMLVPSRDLHVLNVMVAMQLNVLMVVVSECYLLLSMDNHYQCLGMDLILSVEKKLSTARLLLMMSFSKTLI